MSDQARPAHPTDDTSLSLLDRVRQSDDQAWQRLVDLYSPLVYGGADVAIWSRMTSVMSCRTCFWRYRPVCPPFAAKKTGTRFAAGCGSSPVTRSASCFAVARSRRSRLAAVRPTGGCRSTPRSFWISRMTRHRMKTDRSFTARRWS